MTVTLIVSRLSNARRIYADDVCLGIDYWKHEAEARLQYISAGCYEYLAARMCPEPRGSNFITWD